MQHRKDQYVIATVAVDEENHIRYFLAARIVQGFYSPPSRSLDYRLHLHDKFLQPPTSVCCWVHIYLPTFYCRCKIYDGEVYIDYERMIDEVNRIILQHTKIFVFYCDLSLIKAIKEKWLSAFIIICRWHITNNIITRCRRTFVMPTNRARHLLWITGMLLSMLLQRICLRRFGSIYQSLQ